MNLPNKVTPEWIKERGIYWSEKTGWSFYRCFGTFRFSGVGCHENVASSKRIYDACRECKKITVRPNGEITLDEILGFYGDTDV